MPMTRNDVLPLRATETRVAARAMLILLVMIGHNRILHDHLYYSLYIFIYAFHVGAFFLLTTLSPPRPIDRASLTSLARKILLPFLIFTCLYAVLAKAAGASQYYGGWDQLPRQLLIAVSIANAWVLDIVAGLKMLWFLPAFFAFCLLYNVYGRLRGWPLNFAVLLAALAHLGVGAIPLWIVRDIPWSANIVAYLLLPAFLFIIIARHVEHSRPAQLLCALLFAFASAIAIHNRFVLILSDSDIPSLWRPLALVIGDIQLIAGSILCLIVGRQFARFAVARWLGVNSIKLYLLHPVVNVAALRLIHSAAPWPVALLAVSTVTVAGTSAMVALLNKTALRRLFG